ncbi:MAG: glycosyltransferase, partial [Propionicimonas sp.]
AALDPNPPTGHPGPLDRPTDGSRLEGYRRRGAHWARRIADAWRIGRSGIVDLEYCRAQTGRRFHNAFAAGWYYLGVAAESDFSPHPLFDPATLGSRVKPGTAALIAYLTQPDLYETLSPHPVFSLPSAKRRLRAGSPVGRSRPHPDGGTWLTWVKTATTATPVPVSKAFGPISWGELRTILIGCAADWRIGGGRTDPGAPLTPISERTPGLTSVIVPIVPGEDSLRRLALLAGAEARELVCIAATRTQYSCLTVLGRTRPVLVRRSAGSVAKDWNAGAAASSGARLVFVAPNWRLRADAVDRLAVALDDRSIALAQPLNENPDMTVHSAGAYFGPDSLAPSPLLNGHPTADAERLGRRQVPAAFSGVLAVRSDLYVELAGFDEGFGNDLGEVDFSLRATEAGAGQVVVVPEARVTVPKGRATASLSDAAASLRRLADKHAAAPPGSAEYLAAAGFEVVGHPLPIGAHSGGRIRGPELARTRTGLDALPSLRWTIDTPVTSGWWAEIWGDWHFAASLARALRRLGQHVAVDTKQARGRETRRFDDVLLTLRGLDRVEPAAGRVNLMWVISHPDEVTAAEVSGYDRVFAASPTWAAARSAEWGVGIEPLQQCTDAEFFHPGRATSAATGRALFVGNARREGTRPIVEAVLAAGIELDLYGTGWEQVPAAAGKVVALRVPNTEAGRLYADAAVVLNDHWEDMRHNGFISNRLFDAVASGSRVLSDAVAGAEELFGGSVQFCATPDEAVRLLREPLDRNWPDRATRLANAERVRREHSFDQRAEVLLAAAIEALRHRGGRSSVDLDSSLF